MSRNRVCIVGGGLGGVTVASLLSKRRPDLIVTVMEASDRINGRLDSVELTPGLRVNLGANWLMGEKNPLLSYLNEAGVALEPIPCSADDYDDIRILEYSQDDFHDVTEKYQDSGVITTLNYTITSLSTRF